MKKSTGTSWISIIRPWVYFWCWRVLKLKVKNRGRWFPVQTDVSSRNVTYLPGGALRISFEKRYDIIYTSTAQCTWIEGYDFISVLDNDRWDTCWKCVNVSRKACPFWWIFTLEDILIVCGLCINLLLRIVIEWLNYRCVKAKVL